jgi:hypothetical protein
MTAFPVENRARLPEAEFAPLAVVLAGQRSLKHAIDWLVGHRPPLAPADLVAQDEFSHDLLVEYPGGVWLVYDST